MTASNGPARQRSGFRPRNPDRGSTDRGSTDRGSTDSAGIVDGAAARAGSGRFTDTGALPYTAPAPDASVAPEHEADPAAAARAIVLRQLTTSPKSRLQLARKLAERNIPEDVAEAVLDRFEEVRLVDDAEFAEMWVRSRSQTRKLAKGALRRELAEKGIDADTAAGALEQLSDEDEEAAARELVERKLRGTGRPADRAERDKATRRLASMLARKGYQPSQAFRVVAEVFEAADRAENDL